jgi:lipopolysaccharide/colanic/teichoic acid biosynthesis glycosyltransferase
MLTSQSDGIDAALAFAPAERSHAPQRPRVRSLALVAADVAGLALTVLLCAKFLPISAPGAAAGIPLAAAVWIVAFERAGLYRQSISVTARDEVYAVAAAICLGLMPLLVLSTVPRFAGMAGPIVIEAAVALALVGAGRVAVFATGFRLPPPQAEDVAAVSSPATAIVRRTLDLVLVLPALVFAAPLLAAASLAVLADSGRPVIFRQRRVGLNGREFDIYKFRTMPVDAEDGTGPVWADPGDTRSTRIGRLLRRTSVDELPQLFNVLRGDMSFVGPRPERPEFVARFRAELPGYDERHAVPPGITGWAHVNMRRNVDITAIGERLDYDLFYLRNWSSFFDATILVKTLAEFLFHDAA